MGMHCVKTGCHLYLQELRQSVHGDLFYLQERGIYCMQVSWSGHEPSRPVLNGQVSKVAHWFMEDFGTQRSVLVFEAKYLHHYSYKGEPLTFVAVESDIQTHENSTDWGGEG